MTRFIYVMLAIIAGLGVMTYVGTSFQPLSGVYNGTIVITEGQYRVVDGHEVTMFNTTVVNGVVVVNGTGAVVQGEKLACRPMVGPLSGVIVLEGPYVGNGKAVKIGNVTILEGEAILLHACVYYHKK